MSDVLASVLAREPDWARLPATLSPHCATYRQALSAEGSEATYSRHRGRASGAGGRVRDGRAADDDHVIGAGRTAGLDGRVRRRGGGHSRDGDSRGATSARDAATTAARDARRDRHARHRRSPRRLRSRPTAGRSSSWPRVKVVPDCGCGPWRRRRRSRWPAPRVRRFPSGRPTAVPIGFFAGSALKRLDLGGGAPQTLAPVVAGRGGTWNAGRRHRVCAEPDDSPDARVRHRGRGGGRDDARPAAGRPSLSVFSARRPPVPVQGIRRPGRDRDLSRRARRERPDPVGARRQPPGCICPPGGCCWRGGHARGPAAGRGAGRAHGRAGDAGRRGRAASCRWRPRGWWPTGRARAASGNWRGSTGRARRGAPSATRTAVSADPRVSPDGRRVAVARTVQGNTDIWLLDGARTSRVTFDAAADLDPLWSPDGTRIVFRSNRTRCW